MSSSYNQYERYIAKFLEKNPKIKLTIKKAYQYIQYRLKGGGAKVVSDTNIDLISSQKVDGFFGYYDKSCWDPTTSTVAFHEINQENEKLVDICIINERDNKKRVIGSTVCWNWQQGAMITWIDSHTLAFNTVKNNLLGCTLININSSEKCFINYPIQCLAKDKTWYASINYLRLTELRPDYGYEIECKNYRSDLDLEDDGINIITLTSKSIEYFLSINQVVEFEKEESMKFATHKLNHLSSSTDSSKLAFMHRWFEGGYKRTRLIILDLKTRQLTCVFNNVMFSHYDWVNDDTIFAWCRGVKGDGYYMIDLKAPKLIPTDLFEVNGFTLNSNGDGHPSVSPNGKYIITDTYPAKDRMQSLVLIDLENKSAKILAKLFSPWKYQGLERCDLHPRWSPCSKFVAFDSTHEGVRGLYRVDIC